MKRLLIFISTLISFIGTTVWGQIGFKYIHGDNIRNEYTFDILELPNKAILATGSTTTPNYIQLSKISNNGILLNQQLYNNNFYNIDADQSILYNDNIYTNTIIDSVYSPNNIHHSTLQKRSSTTLSLIWINNYIDSIAPLPSSTLLKNNFIYRTLSRHYNPCFIKFDTNGNILLKKEINGPFMYGKSVKSILDFSDSTFILIGDGNISVAAKDRWMIKLHENGDTIFTKVISNYGEGWVTSATKTYNKNSFYILGNSIARYNIEGNLISNIYYPEMSVAFSMEKTKDSNYIIGGIYQNNFALMKIDTSGNVLWNRTFDNDNKYDLAHKAIQTLDSGYIIAGTTSYNGKIQSLIIKLDSLGNLQNATSIDPNTNTSNNILLYPNPTNNTIHLSNLLKNDLQSYQVNNNLG